jgi:hypothetical protein
MSYFTSGVAFPLKRSIVELGGYIAWQKIQKCPTGANQQECFSY